MGSEISADIENAYFGRSLATTLRSSYDSVLNCIDLGLVFCPTVDRKSGFCCSPSE